VAKRRIRASLLKFAERIGATRGGRPDWYRVAETLAEMFVPELVAEDKTMTRGPGRPKNDDDFLAMEVHRVMLVFDIGVEEACRRISRGDKVPGVRLWSPGKPAQDASTVGSPWKGTKPGTLEQRYWRWKKAEQWRQKKLAIEIR
jgi:hypothetical protein